MIFGDALRRFRKAPTPKKPRRGREPFLFSITGNDAYTPPPTKARELVKLYNTNPWVRSIVSKVGQSVARQPWYLEGKGGKRVDQHPALDFLRAGSPALVGRLALKVAQAHKDLAGEAFLVVGRGPNGVPMQWAPIPPHWVQDVPEQADGTGFYEIHPTNGKVVNVPATDVIWLRDVDPLEPFGRGAGITGAASVEISTDASAAKFLDAFFQNDARPAIMVSGTKDAPMKREDSARLETTWMQRFMGASKKGRPFFSAQPLEVTEVGAGLRDNEISKIRDQLRAALREIYGVPPEIFGHLDSSNRATIESADYLLARHTVDPRLSEWEATLEPWLIVNFNLAGYKLRYESPIEEDRGFHLDVVKAAPRHFTRNEIRALAKLPPVAGGDVMPDDEPSPREPGTPGGGGDKPAADDSEDDPAKAAPTKSAEPVAKAEPVAVASVPAPVAKALSPENIIRVSAVHEAPQAVANIGELVRPILYAAIERYGAELLEELADENKFRLGLASAEYVATELPTLVGQINETTREALRRSLEDGVAATDDVAALVARIEAVFDDAAERRAPLIGTTTATKLTGHASLEAARQGGFEQKRWLSSRDHVVRDSHRAMHGQTVPLSQPFKSPRGGRAMHPGAFREGAEDINCRCAMRPVVPGEAEKANPISDEDLEAWHDKVHAVIADKVDATLKKCFAEQKALALNEIRVLTRNT